MNFDIPTLLLLLVAGQVVLIIFKTQAQRWSYKSYKPFGWMEQLKNESLSPVLQALEKHYLDKVRFYNFWFQIQRLKRENIPGAFAELGVYKGETARFIHAMDQARVFHLFDTFTGFTEQDLAHETHPNKACQPNQFSDTSLAQVKQYLSQGHDRESNLVFHPGYFPETVVSLSEESFALVHLDADLYWPTLKACEYFYPRLTPGGVLLVHDYNHNWPGIKQALDEFSQTIPENLIEVPDRQGTVMLIKQKKV